jgi:hypothetical protein
MNGCEEILKKNESIALPVAFSGYSIYAGIGLLPFTKSKGIGGAVAGVGGAALIGSGIYMASEWYQRKSQKRALKNSLEILQEAALLEPPASGRFMGLYQRTVKNNPKFSPSQLSNIILEANKRATFCPLFEKPMTDKAIEAWVKIYIRDKAPL